MFFFSCRFILVKFNQDSIVQPVETEWFQFYIPGEDKVIQKLSDSNAAKRLGLNDLVAANKMVFLSSDGDHLKFSRDWFIENVVPYLNGEK